MRLGLLLAVLCFTGCDCDDSTRPTTSECTERWGSTEVAVPCPTPEPTPSPDCHPPGLHKDCWGQR